jgi:glutaredoxin 3
MAEVVIYSSGYCPYCIRAKMLLETKQVDYQELIVDGEPALRAKMQQLSGRTSVPQIWIGERHVGGFTDLWALESNGELDEWLVAV